MYSAINKEIPTRIVDLQTEIKGMKTSQILNGDNSKAYTYAATTSGEVKDSVNNFVFDDNSKGVFVFMSDEMFPLAAVKLRTWVDGTEITSWGDYSIGDVYPLKKNSSVSSFRVGLVSLRAVVGDIASRPSILQNPLALGWRVWVEGWQMPVGLKARFELTVMANHTGSLVAYEW